MAWLFIYESYWLTPKIYAVGEIDNYKHDLMGKAQER